MATTRILIFLLIIKNIFCLPSISRFAVYYGKNNIEKLKKFEMVILQSKFFTEEEIYSLKSNNVITIAYFSVGEIAELVKGDGKGPGGWASFYMDKNKDGLPDKNPNWNSYYINPGSNQWQEYSLRIISDIKRKGFDGILLDTIDTVDIYPELKKNFVDYIIWIKSKIPSFILIINRGFSIIDNVYTYIDAILFECFSTYYDFKNKKYMKWEGNDLKWTEGVMEKIKFLQKKKNFLIFVLDYSDKNNKDLINYSLERGRKYNLPVYISEINLNSIF